MLKPTRISVIIPVYNDRDRLTLCLEHLINQDIPESYEILVVDNGSDEDIQSVVKEFQGAHYLFEEKVGSYAARNKGITEANGEIIAFTDSDCIPDKSWLKEGFQHMMENQHCDIAGGSIQLISKSHTPNLVERYDMLFGFNQDKAINNWGYTVTANLFTRKKVFEKHGLFNHNLKSGGDVEWCQRVLNKGGQICHVENAIIKHPSLSTLKQFYNKHSRVSGGKSEQIDLTLKSILKRIKQYIISIKSAGNTIISSRPRSEVIGLISIHILRVCIYITEMLRVYFGGKTKR